MHLAGMEVGAGCSRPGACCPHAVQNWTCLVNLASVPQPSRYFKHEMNKIPYRSRCSVFAKQYYDQPKRRLSIHCRSSDKSSTTSSSSSLANLDPEEIEQRIQRAANFITTSEKLIPFDPSSTHLGLVIWQALRDIPLQHRPQLISRLSSGYVD